MIVVRSSLIIALLVTGRVAEAEPKTEPDAEAGNRLAYLDDFCNPYYAHGDFAKLVTPQWVGEAGVESVITLGIDDMRDAAKYEAYLRPLLERLKKIDGRAPVSIMTCSIDPNDPQLQKWLAEGLSIEVHTVDHPCPCLKDGDFERAKSTYDRCVQQVAAIRGNRPVAFRFPCCDSLNTPSPRAFAEIINRTTPDGQFLQLSSSVCALLTANDPDLPRDLVMGSDGRPRFSRYAPFESFVNKVENYPYPFVIGRLCWEFPIAVPDDWQGQHLNKPNNPQTVDDINAMIDATTIKQGVANIVFHPHGWIRSDQMVAVVDHVVEKHGSKVKILNFGECVERLNKNLLAGQPLRAANGSDNGVRLLDVNNDGFLDVVIGNEKMRRTRIWQPKKRAWLDAGFPVHIDSGVRFGVLQNSGDASFFVRNERAAGVWHFDGQRWVQDAAMLAGLEVDGKPVLTSVESVDQGVRLRDLTLDGVCELICGGRNQQAVFVWHANDGIWQRAAFALPDGAAIVDAKGHDAGLRFVDIDEDGHDDVIFSNERSFGLYLFDSMKTGWSRELRTGRRGDPGTLPMISRSGTNNGAWTAGRHIWWQNEDTTRLPSGVDRRSFAQLLGYGPARPKSPEASLRSIEVPEGFQVELVAAEPLTRDPVAFDWGPDGRLWVVEMADYPLGVDGKGKRGGRVRVLEDTTGDGRYDKSRLFLDNLSTPTGIMVWRRGVLITAAPDVIYAEDTDGDGVADRKEPWFTGFGTGNEQHRVNGLRYGLDNWVYLANGDSGGQIVFSKPGEQPSKRKVDVRGRDIRIRPDQGLVEPASGQTQFGRSRDDWGNWFGCNNPNPIFHFVLADHYLRRNPHFAPPAVRRDIRSGGQLVYPISPMISHCDTKYRPLGAPANFTSANSTIVYRDNLFGAAYSQSTFTSEPVYNVVHRRVLVVDGVSFRSGRPIDDERTEFFRSSDPWCRPAGLRIGPDGALYVADMYREVIEHPEWINDELEKQLDVRAGEDRGRIYRIAPTGVPRRSVPRLDKLDTAGLVAALESPNGWQRDMVQAMLTWRADDAAVAPLEEVATSSQHPLARLHALCSLDGLGRLREPIIRAALGDSHPGVRRHALRLCEAFLQNSPPESPLVKAVHERADDSDPLVQLQLAYSLGEGSDRSFGSLLAKLAHRHAAEPYLEAAVMSSLNDKNIDDAAAALLAMATEDEAARPLVARMLSVAAGFGDHAALADVLSNFSELENGTYAIWQLATLGQFLDTLAANKVPVDKLLDAELKQRVEDMFRQARLATSDDNLPEADRCVAIQLIAHGRLASAEGGAFEDLKRLAALLAPNQSPALQSSAASALAQTRHDQVPELLLANWRAHSPAIRSQVLDILLGRQSWTADLLEAIDKGRVQAAHLDAARRQRLLTHRDASLRKSAMKLLSAASGDDRQNVVEDFHDAITLAGDVNRGKDIFQKRCATCHRLDGAGHPVGPDITAIVNRSPAALLVAVLDPSRAVEDKFISYEAIDNRGRSFSGIIATENSNSITLVGQDGKQHTVLRSEIDQLRSSGKSLMPDGLERDLSRQGLADVIAYVSAVGSPPKKFDGNVPVVVKADASGVLKLHARHARIYGRTLELEKKYQNLGQWYSQDDRAAWSITVPRGATYRVEIDYACHDNTAGNAYLFEIAEQQITGAVKGTGHWGNYRQISIGQIKLTVGAAEAVFRPAAPPKNALIDLCQIRLVPLD